MPADAVPTLAAEQTTLAVQIGKLDQKIDDLGEAQRAIHYSLKEDIAELKTKVTETNGRVKLGELRWAELRGTLRTFAFASPFLVAAVSALLVKLLG